jgi:hypothetical protein
MYDEKRGKKLHRGGLLVEVVLVGSLFGLRLQVIVVLPRRHLDEGVLQVRLAGRSLREPDLVEAFSADAAAEVGMELSGSVGCGSRTVDGLQVWLVKMGGYLDLRESLKVQHRSLDVSHFHDSRIGTAHSLAESVSLRRR